MGRYAYAEGGGRDHARNQRNHEQDRGQVEQEGGGETGKHQGAGEQGGEAQAHGRGGPPASWCGAGEIGDCLDDGRM